MPNVAFIREEVKKLMPSYALIRDCIEGEPAIKKAGDKYLPRPNAEDVSPANIQRYKSYKERAVFYNVTQHTLAGLAGQVFARMPVVEVPNYLDVVIADADGGGVSAEQLAKRVTLYTLAYGRSGLLVDYPTTEAAATKEQLDKGEVRPTINAYAPWDVINWRKMVRGSKEILSLVVLKETYVVADDGFEMKKAEQWRVLRLVNDKYEVTIWRKGGQQIYQIAKGPYYPTDVAGNNLVEIPFTFIGAENNDDTPDLPPLYDLASINIAHYRNSADYEESCYIVGQPTPYFAGLTEDWVNNVLKGTIALGSRGAVPLPEGGSAGLLQAEANTMPFEAMEHKERQMVALGAKIVQEKTTQRTATEASIENTAETSTLSSTAKNISSAFQWAFEWCSIFVDTVEAKVKFELNSDFDLSKMTPQERAQTVAEWQAGAICFEEMRANLRRAGVAKLDDAAAKTKIDEELAQSIDLENEAAQTAADIAAQAAATAAANKPKPTA